MNTATGETMKKMIPQVDKALKTLNLPIGDKFMFGDTISVADLQVPFFRNEKAYIQCLQFKLFLDDAAYNEHYDMRSVLEAAPVMHQLAKNAAKHPIIAEYLVQDGNSPFTGLNILE